MVWNLGKHEHTDESKLSHHFRFHLEKSSGYKPVGGSNFTGNQHVVVGEIRGKVILVVPV